MVLTLCILNLLGSLLIVGLSVPMIQGKVRRNALYGMRTPKTLSSDAIWYPANRYAGRALFTAGAIQAALTLPLLLIGLLLGKDVFAVALLASSLVTLGWAILQSFAYLKRLS